MKYLIFNPSGECTGYFDTQEPDSVPYDFDPDKIWFSTLRLENDKVIHLYPNLSRQDQEKQFNKDKEEEDFKRQKESMIPLVKIQAANQIRELDWKLERAKEQDQLSGGNSKTLEILSLRQAIRDASNAMEIKIMSCENIAELEKIDIKHF